MSSSNYSSADYWDTRYKNDEDAPYDWLFSYDDVQEALSYLLPDRNSKILVIGCGNAPFSPDMYHIGHYNKLFNIDLSSVVIEQQAVKYPEQIWKVMNAMNMDFPDESFPTIIDKSLIDTLLCASHSKEKTACMIKECHRVLKPGGRFITFSLHTIEEVESSYQDAGLDWKVSCFRIKSDRWNDTNNRKRSRAHTMIVCDKACTDGSYLHEHPLVIPSGVLTEDEYARLKAEADQVNLTYSMKLASVTFLSSALFHALHKESAIRNMRLKLLEERCAEAGKTYEQLEELSMTPVVDEAEVLQHADYSLSAYIPETEAVLQQALKDVHKLDVHDLFSQAMVPNNSATAQ